MEQCAACEARLHGVMPKNMFLTPRSRHVFCLLVMRPDAPFRTGVASKRAGTARLGFATGEDMERMLGTRPGSLSPLSLQFDEGHAVRLLMDASLQREERLLVHPCDNRCTLALARTDLLKLLSCWGRDAEWIDLNGSE